MEVKNAQTLLEAVYSLALFYIEFWNTGMH